MAKIIQITPTLDTEGAYADGYVLFNPIELSEAYNHFGQCMLLQSVAVSDDSDQGAAFDLVFFDTTGMSLGTIRTAVSPSDSDLRKSICRTSVGSADYYDFGGARFADVGNIGKLLQSNNSRSLWVGGVCRGAPTSLRACDSACM